MLICTNISLNYLSCIAISWVWLDIDAIRVKTMLLIPHQNLLSNQRALDKSILCFSTLYFLHLFLLFLVQLDLFLNCKQFISRKHSNLEFIVCLFHTLQTFSLSCPVLLVSSQLQFFWVSLSFRYAWAFLSSMWPRLGDCSRHPSWESIALSH